MAIADRYSRLVLWLKVALPLAALAILSTLFFVAETLDPEAAIPYADVDVEQILRDQGITQPTFGGLTADGVAISVSADAVRPEAGKRDRLTGSSLAATLEFPSGSRIDIDSPEGTVDGETEKATLQGGAVLKSSTGYVVETDRIMTSMAEASVLAPQTVTATGPAGKLTAGQMELTRTQTPDQSYLLVFRGGVRLVYTPRP